MVYERIATKFGSRTIVLREDELGIACHSGPCLAQFSAGKLIAVHYLFACSVAEEIDDQISTMFAEAVDWSNNLKGEIWQGHVQMGQLLNPIFFDPLRKKSLEQLNRTILALYSGD